MLRKLFIILMLGAFSWCNFASAQMVSYANLTDRPVVWPWGHEQPFPWAEIKGLWKIENSDYDSYFTFKVVRHKQTGNRQLEVRQVDAHTCEVIANGPGYERGRVVRAQMTHLSGAVFRLAITAFRQADLPKDAVIPPGDAIMPVMVVSIADLDSNGALDFHAQIVKVSDSINLRNCVNIKR